ncbi:hypothetical protein DFR68_11118 [Nocardia mexicana]|uniref:Uncharacterized protein n=1 Tax=Nocardia mexicana TaxID=279262 RepID=A0A370GSG6_9NOCA|nr:hypothetical protein DFR68_11118 [Nocardia mexicana]
MLVMIAVDSPSPDGAGRVAAYTVPTGYAQGQRMSCSGYSICRSGPRVETTHEY